LWQAWLAGHLKWGTPLATGSHRSTLGWLVPWLPLVTLLSLGLGAGGIPCQLPHPGCSCRLYFWCAGRCQFCPAGWLWDAGRCYYFSSAKKSWEQSREDCCSKGAQLVTIRANTTLVTVTSRVSAPWLWPMCPKPSQASRQGPGDAVPVLRSLGLSGGLCGEALGWVCEQSAATLQWLRSSPPAFLWGNTTYTCVGP
uniref:C-type lectin domain-containing protein n=1 Tax=Aquila chrysaetos chrysaetos TaxID=223781 RepID=A0A663EWF0_AQUCH